MKRGLCVAAAIAACTLLLTSCSTKDARMASGGGSPCPMPCAMAGGKPCDQPCAETTGRRVADWTHFGEPMKLAGAEAVCAKNVLAAPDAHAGKYIRVCGKVDSVCAHKGCWIRLEGPDGGETLFVKFTCPVDGRLVPMAAVGRMAVVEGTFEVKEIPESEARHYEEESGASAEAIARIVGPQKMITLRAPAASIDLPREVAAAR